MQTFDTEMKAFQRKLSENNLRFTKTKKALFDTLRTSTAPLSIQAIAEATPSAHFVSIYRSIDALYKAGIVRRVANGFQSMYELSEAFKPHHHHATCNQCGKLVDIHNDQIESLMDQLAREAGIEPTDHHFEIHGYCKECRTKNQ